MATCSTCGEAMLTEWPHVHRDPRRALRKALDEWESIQGTSTSSQFRALIAAGKMADAIRAALDAKEPG